jgi:hypothetical protein
MSVSSIKGYFAASHLKKAGCGRGHNADKCSTPAAGRIGQCVHAPRPLSMSCSKEQSSSAASTPDQDRANEERRKGRVASYFVIMTQHLSRTDTRRHARREGARRDPEVHQFARMCAAGRPAAGATPPPRMARLQASQPCARATQHHLPSFLNRHRKWSITKKGLLGSSPQEQAAPPGAHAGTAFPSPAAQLH